MVEEKLAAVEVVIGVHRQADSPQIVQALGTARGLAGHLHGGEQQRDQRADDGDDNEQFNQCQSGVFHAAIIAGAQLG